MNRFLRYLADKNSAHRQTDRHTPMTTRPCGLRRAGNYGMCCRYLASINQSSLKKSFTKKSFTKGLQAFYGLPQPLRLGAVRLSLVRFLLYTVTLSAMLIGIGKHNFQHSVVLGGQPVSHQFTAAFCSFLCLLTQNGIEISRQLQTTGC